VNRRLRICHLAYTFYENDGRVIRYAEALAERGHSVDVVALKRTGQKAASHVRGVRVLRIQRRQVNEKRSWVYLAKLLWFQLKATLILAALSARHRYDVVHVHNVPDFLVFAAIVPKFLGARIILDIHDILPELYGGKFGADSTSGIFRRLQVVERLSCRFADHVIIANDLWRARLIERSVEPERCTTVLNYPDLRLFGPRTDGPCGADRFVFLYPGTLNHHQGLDLAVKAFTAVADQMPGAEFHIYGEGPAKADLQTMAAASRGRVKVMDRVPLHEVAALMAAADAGVVPKRADGFGNEAFSTKIFEFMACGVPVIVSRTQIDAHYFNDTLVRFFTPGEVADLARAMLQTFADRHEQAAWISTAREFAVRNSWQERVIDYLQIVELLVGARYAHAA
jgi:glycosyltransferase involved in cell wall biosynthesis